MQSKTPSVNSILSHVGDQTKGLPPVEQWDPPYCGEMNLVIRANGEWWHENSPIGRKKLFRLFSTILKKTGDDYFLVTPVEKIKITVEWQPFTIIDFQKIEHQGNECLEFVDQCDNKIILTNPQQLKFSEFQGQQLPIINVRRNLYASFSRSCYYRLIEHAQITQQAHEQKLSVFSNGQEFLIGSVKES